MATRILLYTPEESFINSRTSLRLINCSDNKPPTIAIPVPSDKKLVKFSKLIPEATSSSERLLDTIFDITVLVKDNPPITNINIKVVNHILNSTKNAIVKKLIEIDNDPKIKTNNDPGLATQETSQRTDTSTPLVTGKITLLPNCATFT